MEKEGLAMEAVLSAFIEYLGMFIVLVAAAAGGYFCGKKLREKKNLKDKTTDAGNRSGK